MKRHKRRQAGISLIELMVTMFLVLLGLVVVMGSFVASAKANRYGERADVASALMKLEMERVRNMNFDDVDSEAGDYGEYTQYPDFRHERLVTEVGSIKQIDVTIFFENDRRSASVVTFLSDL